ncbi:MAG: hypothetical protein AUH43_13720 [Acidobacteria bacterium 13_1_40CM_65_14]|nr:MAG: hypothetical protein AUH43_13720 [Acidobacteria bacterium 13_1_40CM_65_14]OLE84929.1 MAG: hypothetical protein AUF76_02110 [Acidobacteria bacterium 13_1_20CM_2_65_9]
MRAFAGNLTKLVRLSAMANGLAVVVVGASRLNWPAGFWSDKTAWVLSALFVTGLVPIVQTVVSERGERAR